MEYNIYCDESCHIENDKNTIMVLGGIKCDKGEAKRINSEILSIKEEYGLNKKAEIKWTKVSPGNADFFKRLLMYFFNNDKLSFRGYICRGKDELDHDGFSQSYNDWYYKMYYRMIEYIIDQDKKSTYNLYLDIKDTIGNEKVKTLQTYLNNHCGQGVIRKIQIVRSHEIGIIQLTDLLIGALSYKNRYLKSSKAKLDLIDIIEENVGYSLHSTVPMWENKANWFVWTPSHWR